MVCWETRTARAPYRAIQCSMAFLRCVIAAGLTATVPLSGASLVTPSPSPQERAQKLVDDMTLDEKLSMLHGSAIKYGRPYTGYVPGE